MPDRICCDGLCFQKPGPGTCPACPQVRNDIPSPTLPLYPFAPGAIQSYRRAGPVRRACRALAETAIALWRYLTGPRAF